MNILELVDIDVPVVTDKVDFYTVDASTLSFIKFGAELFGTNNSGKVVSLYVITMEDIAALSINVTSSSNITAKVLEGTKIPSDFSVESNNNTIVLNNVTQNTPIRITLFYSINTDEWSNGSLSFVWSY